MVAEQDRRWVGSMPALYDRWLGPSVFGPFATDLTSRASRLDTGRVLELAAGTGVLTRELVAAGARVTATDLNPAMVEYGSQQVPDAVWEQADAMRLPYPDAAFDLVVAQFGVMFLPDRPAGFAEARRVLAPGGRLLFNTWDTIETHGFEHPLVIALHHLLTPGRPLFLETIPHGYTDLTVITADLAAGGMKPESLETVTVSGRAETTADLVRGYCLGTPLRADIENRADLDTTIAATIDLLETRLGPGPLTITMSAHVIEASALS
jgi:SAM-dependent methyltransferase